ncbi:MAG: hypothetical protein M3065_04030, partial [Actinomycetota bacterium]|nr:hypothetical protein [Actinomycetota bacterium]
GAPLTLCRLRTGCRRRSRAARERPASACAAGDDCIDDLDHAELWRNIVDAFAAAAGEILAAVA